jgi:hypothetical protein
MSQRCIPPRWVRLADDVVRADLQIAMHVFLLLSATVSVPGVSRRGGVGSHQRKRGIDRPAALVNIDWLEPWDNYPMFAWHVESGQYQIAALYFTVTGVMREVIIRAKTVPLQ